MPDRPDLDNAGSPGAVLPEAEAAALAEAAAGLARLDERLAGSPEPVRAAWRNRAWTAEASASARLDGPWADPDDVLLFESDAADRIPDPALTATRALLAMLRAAARRSPAHLFTPRRLAALAQPRLPRRRPGPPVPDDLMPAWLAERLGRRPDPLRALGDALAPEAVAAWKRRTPLLAAADLLARWHRTDAAEALGGGAGRVLAAAWLWRAGATGGLVLLPGLGFLGHAADYRPWDGAAWTPRFLAAAARAAAAGLALLDDTRAAHERLRQASRGQRSTSRLSRLGDVLLAEGPLSAKRGAELLDISPQAASTMLQRLVDAGAAVEISSRAAFRVYRAR